MRSALSHRIFVILFIGCFACILIASLWPSSGGEPLFKGVDKVGHFLAYASFSFLATFVFESKSSRLLIWTAGIFLGILLEYLQSFVPGREVSLYDELANVSGILSGAFLGYWVNRVKRIRD